MLSELERLTPRLSTAPLAPVPHAVPEAELPSGQVPTQLLAPPSGREPTRPLSLEPPPRQRPPGKPRSVLLPIAVAVSVLAVVVLGVAAVLVWRWRGH